MELKINFFDEEKWTLYGTSQAFIILLIMLINKNNSIFNIKLLTFCSLIGLMSSTKPIPRLTYTFFLCLLMFFYEDDFLFNTLLALSGSLLLCILITNRSKYDKIIQLPIFRNLLVIGIVIWFVYFIYSIYLQLS